MLFAGSDHGQYLAEQAGITPMREQGIQYPDPALFFPTVEVVSTDELTGVPTWLHGDLGQNDLDQLEAATSEYLRDKAPVFKLNGADEFRILSSSLDENGPCSLR